MLKLNVILFFAISAFATLLNGVDDRPEPRPFHEQSREGVTVRIEKISVERVFIKTGSKNGKLQKRSVSVLVSINGPRGGSGPLTVAFANGFEANVIKGTGMSPPFFKPRVPFEVPSHVAGHERSHFIPDDMNIKDLFPATVTIQTATKSGDKLEFVFKNVEL